MSHQAYTSIGTSRRKGNHHLIDRYTDVDRSVYTVGQTLASIINDPRTAGQTSGGFWGLAHDASQTATAPALDPTKYPHVTKADVQSYTDLVHEAYDRFIRDRQSLKAFDAQHHSGSPGAGTTSQGEPFMAAMQAVPVQFFQEGFFDSWDDFFKQFCQDQSTDELYEHIEKLNKNLDVVELQLLREVASRSESFFQAASTLHDLLAMLADSSSNIHGLRKSLAAADEQLCSTAGAVKALQSRKSSLQATMTITKGLEEVVAAQQALDCLLEAQDYAGALDLLYELKTLLEQPSLLGLQCVRHLPPRLADTTAAVEGALANEFLNTLANSDLPRVVMQAASDAEAQPDAGTSPDDAGAGHWQLPQSTTAGSNMSAAALEQLQEKMMPLAVGLYRCGRLLSTLQLFKTNVGDEVKGSMRDVVQQVLPLLLSAGGDVSSAASQQHQPAAEAQLSEQLQLLHHGSFMVLLFAAARVIYSCMDHAVCVGRLLENILDAVNTPASQLLSTRKESSSALQFVVDVALGRWVKLLSARGAAHSRLKQYELRQLLDLSEQVAAHCESLGTRTPSSFRSALQSQCKALLDASHARHMNQLQHLLEGDQWVAVEVPGGFQAIVDRMVARCGEGAALLDGRVLAPAAAGLSPAGSMSPAPANSAHGTAAATDRTAVSEQHSPKLQLLGKSFYLVNSALMLLKMLDEYTALYELMPQFGAEIVHRELELLKFFNSQTAALVLGAGAMRTAGLRSISAKQLALSCQSVAMVATLLPLLRAGSLALVSQPRRALLMPEFDRLLQDLTLHMDEVHSKLVDIMRDRLSAALQALPAEIRAAPAGSDQVSQTILLLSKQLVTLRSVLVPLLLKEEVEFIFGAVTRAYSDGLSELFAVLMDQDSTSEGVVKANALTMLQAFGELPLDPARASNYSSRLSTTYTKHFGLPPWDKEKLGSQVQQQQLVAQQQEQEQQGHLQQQEQQQSYHIQDPGPPCIQQHQMQTAYKQLQLQGGDDADADAAADGGGLDVDQGQHGTQQQQDQQYLIHQQEQQSADLLQHLVHNHSADRVAPDTISLVPSCTTTRPATQQRQGRAELKPDEAADSASMAAVTSDGYAVEEQVVGQEQASSYCSHGQAPEYVPMAQAAATAATADDEAQTQGHCQPTQGQQMQQQQLEPLPVQASHNMWTSMVGQQPAVEGQLERQLEAAALPQNTSLAAAGQVDAVECFGDVDMAQDVAAVAGVNGVVIDGSDKAAASSEVEFQAHDAAVQSPAEVIIAVKQKWEMPAVASGPQSDDPVAQAADGMVDADEQSYPGSATEATEVLQVPAVHSALSEAEDDLQEAWDVGELQLLKDVPLASAAASISSRSGNHCAERRLSDLNSPHGLEREGDGWQHQQELGAHELQGAHQQNGVLPAGSATDEHHLT